MEEALTDELVARGSTAEEIEKELVHRGLKHVVEESERKGDYLDPAVNPIIMRRLEALFEMLVLASSDGERVRSVESLAGGTSNETGAQGTGTHPEWKRQTSARSEAGSAVSTGGTAEACDPDQRTSARLDTAIQRGLREDNRIAIRFWAPEEIAGHWERAIQAKRAEFAIEIPALGDISRIEPLPVWAAVLMLIQEALGVWELQDPERIPTQHAVLKQDESHCRMPWCSHRCMMEAHHVHYRSRGGSNLMDNKEVDCYGHHRGIHEGWIRVRGRAPHDLIFELGCLPGLPPLLRMHGEKIVQWGW